MTADIHDDNDDDDFAPVAESQIEDDRVRAVFNKLPPLRCMCGTKVIDPTPACVSEVLHICERPECLQAAKDWIQNAAATSLLPPPRIQFTPTTTHAFHTCNEDRCFVCDGGLALCTVCNGAEATLPSACPGIPMTQEEHDLVQSGALDFITGQWVTRPVKP